MFDDKRRTPRVKVNVPVTMQSSEKTTRGVVINFSSGGAYINCESRLAPGEIFDMSVHIQSKAPFPPTKAQVVWSSSHGIGVKWLLKSDRTNPLEEQIRAEFTLRYVMETFVKAQLSKKLTLEIEIQPFPPHNTFTSTLVVPKSLLSDFLTPAL